MSVSKTWCYFALLLCVSGTMASADPLLTNDQGNWAFWTAAGLQVTPSVAAPSASPESPVEAPAPIPPLPPTPAVTSAAPTYFSEAASPAPSSAPASAAPLSRLNDSRVPTLGAMDAYLNFGPGPYSEASILTTGNPQPWFTSPVVKSFFGGAEPNTQQQSDFANAVLRNVEHTFQLSGLQPRLTLDPSLRSSHTLSVVSGAEYGPNPNAIGITDVGHDGFGFIDKLSFAKSLDELEWSVSHNISHELMHAFGVSGHDDTSGKFLDTATATWELLTSPDTRFSEEAIAEMKATAFAPNSGSSRSQQGLHIEGDLEILAQPVPEPTTWAIWGVSATLLLVLKRRQASKAA